MTRTVIVDVDGTVALRNGRGPFDYHLVETDLPNTPVIAVVEALAQAGHEIVFLSGRENVDYADVPERTRHGLSGTCRDATLRWLREHLAVPEFELYMRESGDHRKDYRIKREIYDAHLAGRDILCAIDDRDQAVRLWRESLGLTCLQVAYGDF
ncbi:hypothetical protein [Glycomyces tenuis]|uniref:phosphatase domain-containing protein n=1 Tax=Glycomyces tenuis TaxID=58116 RepID=UPI0003F8EE8D|nr:hypothetical protein [Glycomyces tenuis]